MRSGGRLTVQSRALADRVGCSELDVLAQLLHVPATLTHDSGSSARIAADHLGHAKLSTTDDRYTSRRRVDATARERLDNALVTHDSAAIYDELMMTAEDRRHQTP
jgi:hypothetical protein